MSDAWLMRIGADEIVKYGKAKGAIDSVSSARKMVPDALRQAMDKSLRDNFGDAAEEMIGKNIRTNKEFYIAPAFNQMVKAGGKIIPFYVDFMHGLGTPEDLKEYVEYVKSGA